MSASPIFGAVTRRQALKRTLAFSSGLLTAGWLRRLEAQAPVTGFADDGIHLLVVGDVGMGNADQRAVAAQMAAFAQKLSQPLNSVLLIGDNFYGKLVPERFRLHFEEMYAAEHLNCPFYVVLGNHDYGPQYDSGQGRAKADMQLAYAEANPASRWKQPAKWYTQELSRGDEPLVKMICFDSNYFDGALTPQEKLDQQRFIAAELPKLTSAPWLWMVAHHPFFSNSLHGDNQGLIDRFGRQLIDNPVALYIAGHDHGLQHLQVEGYKTSFIVSGAGGAGLYDVKPNERGFVDKIFGFSHIYVTPTFCDVQYIDTAGRCLHAFRRNLAGDIKVTA